MKIGEGESRIEDREPRIGNRSDRFTNLDSQLSFQYFRLPPQSAPGGPCNTRRKGRQYATGRYCRIASTCWAVAPANDATPCACAAASL